jgi:hypothetical protein
VDFAHSTMTYGAPAPLYEVFTYRLDASKWMEFLQLVEKTHQAIVQHDPEWQYSWEICRNGVVGMVAVLNVRHENWASLQEPEKSMEDVLKEAFGDEEARDIMQAWAQLDAESESFIVQYRPELSYTPAE